MTAAASEHPSELPTGEPQGQAPAAPGRHRWRWHLSAGLLFAVLAGGLLVWTLSALGSSGKGEPSPKVYTLLYVTQQQRSILSKPPKGFMTELDFDNFRRAQVFLVKSRLVLNAAIRHEEAAKLDCIKKQDDPLEWLEENLQVDYPNDGPVLRIGMSCADLKDMQILVKAVTNAYLQELVNRDRNLIHVRLANLKDVCAKYEQAVATKRNTIRQIMRAAANVQVVDPRIQALEQQLLPQELAECRRELRRVKLDKVAAQARLAKLQADKKTREEAPVVFNRLEEEIAVLTEQEKLLSEEEKRLLAKAANNKDAIDLSELQTEIAELEQKIKRLQDEQETLKIELSASPRVTLLQDVTVGKAK